LQGLRLSDQAVSGVGFNAGIAPNVCDPATRARTTGPRAKNPNQGLATQGNIRKKPAGRYDQREFLRIETGGDRPSALPSPKLRKHPPGRGSTGAQCWLLRTVHSALRTGVLHLARAAAQ